MEIEADSVEQALEKVGAIVNDPATLAKLNQELTEAAHVLVDGFQSPNERDLWPNWDDDGGIELRIVD
jgi:hypothetical protein